MKAVGGNSSNDKGQNGVRRRRKIDPLSPPTTVPLRGVQVHFPFKPYPCQVTYMEKVMDALFRSENALLESPTGTGKTLCLLCATLAWQREQARLMNQGTDLPKLESSVISQQAPQPNQISSRRVPTIIYASRTHSQLSQVVRELRNTRYRPQHAVLGSREQMCVNPKVKTAHATGSDINHGCNKLGKDRKCRFRNNLEGFTAPANERCMAGEKERQPVMDMEDLVQMGNTHKVCPFYYTRSQVENAELVLLPYNYLFDKDARSTTLADIPWDNAVVIFDEAHNLESFASDSASFDLSNKDIAGCIQEVQRALNYIQAMPDMNHNLKTDNVVRLKAIFLNLEEHLMNLGNQTALCGEFMMEFFRQGGGITHANHEIMIEEIRKINDLLMEMRGTGATRGSPKLEHFVQCLKRVYGYSLESRCLAKAAFYRVHVSPKPTGNNNSNEGRTVSYWCFAPALAMEELANLNVRSILVTSGTLAPLPSYGMELGLPFPHTLENPHIVTDDQIHVRVIGKGVTGKVLNSSYERRKDGEYYSELGNTLASLAEITPAGMLVFFPSYSVMATSLERWGGPAQYNPKAANDKNSFFAVRRKQAAPKQYSFPQTSLFFQSNNGISTPWKRLLAAKAVVVEPRSSSDLADAMNEFQRFLALPKSPGCILMGVCRGKISEGIDFTHEMSRAVVITGLPFPPILDPKVKLKRDFLDGARSAGKMQASNNGGFGGSAKSKVSAFDKMSGEEWYNQQAHRAVNQAVGRVIRNRSDYGAVLLLDSRFDQRRNQEGLSKWLRPHIRNDEGFDVAYDTLKKFYAKAAEDDKERIEREKKTAELELGYEEEEETITKVAIVKSEDGAHRETSSSKENGTANSPSPYDASTYVAPNKVIARLDVKDMERLTGAVAPSIALTSSDTCSKKEENGKSKFDGVFAGGNGVAGRTQSGTKEVAYQFMEQIKAKLPQSDQSAIKKAIVAMKQAGSENDAKSFFQHTQVVLSLVCRREDFESDVEPKGEQMLFLFFRLLPSKYRERVEKLAMRRVFEASTLCRLSKECLSQLDSGRLQTVMISLLHAIWCEAASSPMPNRAYLAKAEDALRFVYKAEVKHAKSMARAFTKMIPKDYLGVTRTLNDDILAATAMGRMKESAKSRVGEEAIDMSLFHLPLDKKAAFELKQNLDELPVSHPLAPLAKESGSVLPSPDRKRPAALPSSQPKTRINPYKSSASHRTAPVAAATGVVLPHPDRKRPAVLPISQPKKIINPYARKEASSGQPKAASNVTFSTKETKAPSLGSYLKAVESETYVKPSVTDTRKAIQSNAPKNLVCPVCSNRCKEPFLSDTCGHMACLSCWLGWFQRSQTCPTCRTATTRNSLSKAVFAKGDGSSGVPTLSQLCSTNAPNTEESDDDLEIC